MNTLLIVVVAIAYGISMKLADLCNEHGARWFKGDAMVLGVIWGLWGAALVAMNDLIASVMLAMNIAFVPRRRLDYLNHQVAAGIIFISFVLFAPLTKTSFYIATMFFLLFWYFGSIKDFLGGYSGCIPFIGDFMLYYPVPTLAWSWFFGEWTLFWVFLSYTVAYDATKFIFYWKRGHHLLLTP